MLVFYSGSGSQTKFTETWSEPVCLADACFFVEGPIHDVAELGEEKYGLLMGTFFHTYIVHFISFYRQKMSNIYKRQHQNH